MAEAESWRKEVYRPIYHVHKWWAQRLGSVFRAAIIAAASPKGSSVMDLFYQPLRLPGLVVFDPFMGSGTTVGEARKLGCTAIGRDINPVAYRATSVALGDVDRAEVDACFERIQATAGSEIDRLYTAADADGQPCRVLYYFWVKVLPCPCCTAPVDLFPSYIFASHASKSTHPDAQVVCPSCGALGVCRYDATSVACSCGEEFNPQLGPAKRRTAVCGTCGTEFAIAKVAGGADAPPTHRLYAKLVLRADGTKAYVRATRADRAAFDQTENRLAELGPFLPTTAIEDGENTRQIRNYGYRAWHQLFNARQLLALTTLAAAIRDLPPGSARDALAVLFSGVLEFNNMFASYKGEGTGAVRHMFSHHILKPERMPIEANPWGTPKSSGAFSTLYRTRLLRALDYRDAPFEVAVRRDRGRRRGVRVHGLSGPMRCKPLGRYPDGGLGHGSVYLSCGDSGRTDLPDRSVDLVVTDPPFFDNVHYSELADFFYAWQQRYFSKPTAAGETTRRPEEVQDVDAGRFSEKLGRVFCECGRVLRDSGLLVFSYHHSKESGWLALAEAIHGANFVVTQCWPVKSEMSVAAPKRQASQPIDVDILVVCRKRDALLPSQRARTPAEALAASGRAATVQVGRFNSVGRRLSQGDVRVVVASQLLAALSAGREAKRMLEDMRGALGAMQHISQDCWESQTEACSDETDSPASGTLALFGD